MSTAVLESPSVAAEVANGDVLPLTVITREQGISPSAGTRWILDGLPGPLGIRVRLSAISDRTKAALQAYKARGGKLGAQLDQCRNLTPVAVAKGRERSIESRAKAATEAYADLLPIMQELRNAGKTLQGIADELNHQGHTTRRGKAWNQVQVGRVLERAETAA